METLIVELNDRKTLSLLKKMEELNLLRIVKKQPRKNNVANLLLNSINDEQAALMNNELKQMREEWERSI